MKAFLTILLTLFITLCFSQETISTKMKISRKEFVETIEQYIQKEIKQRKIVGLSVAIVDEGGVLISDGFGYANKENKTKASSETLFPIASITKTFTGIAVMQLTEKGLIDLDKPIGDYIEELSLPGGEEKIITTRMLLTHHSGIQGDILYNWYLPEVSNNSLVYEQIVDLVNKEGCIFPPGKMYSYSNSGYSLLGVLIHRVSGIPYVDYVHSNILTPLDMNSAIMFAGEKTSNQIALGYDGKSSSAMPMKLGVPAGGMALSANDAAKYIQAVINIYHGNELLLKTATLHQMMTSQNDSIPIDKGFSIGLTWFLQNPIKAYTKYTSHRGELPPYHSMLVILPELKIGVCITTNTNNSSIPDEMAHDIVGKIYEFQSGETFDIKTHNEKGTFNLSKMKAYEGYYSNVFFGPMKVTARKHKLLVKSIAIPMPLHLNPNADSTFSMSVKLFGFIPLPIKMLQAMKAEFRRIENEKYLVFNIMNNLINPNIKIEPNNIPDDFFDYKGKYRVINMDNSDRIVKDVNIVKNKDFYILKYTFLGNYKFNLALQPIDKEKAIIAGIGQFMGEKIYWKTINNRIKMHWSGLIFDKE
ncbi:MAG: beta-lactamase family protein [Chitinispirillaceae bacterium]|nr:beta-lactamase family protein [Chitinispirillaceae bacterium]